VFLVAALFALGVSWFVQLVLLPWVMPGWLHPSGVLAGHDSIRFHAVAVDQALRIQSEGWTAWELRPNGWGVSGLMSAWYAWFGPHPASWAVVQATVYGLAVTFLFTIMFRITADPFLAAFSVLPALLLPSTLALYVFPHRDVFVFLGLMLSIYGFVRISTLESLRGTDRLLWMGLGSALVMTGYFIAGAVRVFTGELFLGVAGIVFLILLFRAGVCFLRQRKVQFAALVGPAVVLALIVIMVSVDKGGHFDAELEPVEEALVTQSDVDAGWVRAGWLPSVSTTNCGG
jgi:hypothetical protein